MSEETTKRADDANPQRRYATAPPASRASAKPAAADDTPHAWKLTVNIPNTQTEDPQVHADAFSKQLAPQLKGAPDELVQRAGRAIVTAMQQLAHLRDKKHKAQVTLAETEEGHVYVLIAHEDDAGVTYSNYRGVDLGGLPAAEDGEDETTETLPPAAGK